jgi:DNA repair exonuclease SbcCD ATPase subunit
LPSASTGAASVSFDYYGLYDAVSDHFAHVRMLGQTPFVGYAVVDFAPDVEPTPMIDTDFLIRGAEEPEWFIAFGASRAQPLNNFTVVQLPFAGSVSASPARQLEEQLRASQAAERRARTRLAELESAQARPLPSESVPPPPIANDAIYKALEQRDHWIAQLEARALTADMRADESEGELDGLRERLAEREAEAIAARADADRLRAELATLSAEKQSALLELEALRGLLEEQRAAAKAFEGALAGREARHSQLAEQLESETEREVSTLEAQLQARGVEIQRLCRELREAERFGRELVTDLLARNGMTESAPADELSTKLDVLATLNAQREADLAAAHWAIEKLEGELEERLSGDPDAETLVNQLSEARAALQRQAVLLEQARQHTSVHSDAERGSAPLTNPDERSLTE